MLPLLNNGGVGRTTSDRGANNSQSSGGTGGYEELPCILTSCFVRGHKDDERGQQEHDQERQGGEGKAHGTTVGAYADSNGLVPFRIVQANEALLSYADLLPFSEPTAATLDSRMKTSSNGDVHADTNAGGRCSWHNSFRGRELHRLLRLHPCDNTSTNAGEEYCDHRDDGGDGSGGGNGDGGDDGGETTKTPATDSPHEEREGASARRANAPSVAAAVAPSDGRLREGEHPLSASGRASGADSNREELQEPSSGSRTLKAGVTMVAAAGEAPERRHGGCGGRKEDAEEVDAAVAGDARQEVEWTEQKLQRRMFRELAQVC